MLRKVIGGAAVVAACGALVPAASAAPAPATTIAQRLALPYAVKPMRLPQAGPRAASAEPATWLVAARRTAQARAIARRFGARELRLRGTYRVPTTQARALARSLRQAHALVYAEPDATLRRQSALDAALGGWGRGAIVPPTLAAPAPTVKVAIVDDFVDTTLPDLAAQTRLVNPPFVLTGAHGTEVASAVSAVFNGVGVTGVFPGVPLLSYGLPAQITCRAAADGILAVVNAGAKVVNLSFGSPDQCTTLFRAVQAAFASGAIVVAAGGNEFQQGNPVTYPAAWPHVVSVAAVNQALQPAFFSNQNAAIDVAAPGEGVPLDEPLALDVTDGAADGITLDSGTSFASPMVAGAAAWVWSARTTLTNGQLADILRNSAVDVGAPGYDTQTGFGVVNVPNALAAPTPQGDPLEPNDEITFIDGSTFTRPDPFVWRGFARSPLRAFVDVVEDPIDVYRIRVPRRSRARVTLRTTFGDADLFAFSGRRRTLSGRPLARSERNGRATDRVTLTNPSGAARRFYVAIISASRSSLNSAYSLSFRRG